MLTQVQDVRQGQDVRVKKLVFVTQLFPGEGDVINPLADDLDALIDICFTMNVKSAFTHDYEPSVVHQKSLDNRSYSFKGSAKVTVLPATNNGIQLFEISAEFDADILVKKGQLITWDQYASDIQPLPSGYVVQSVIALAE